MLSCFSAAHTVAPSIACSNQAMTF